MIRGKFIYIGKGTHQRPFDFDPKRRSKEWIEVIGNAKSFDVKILKWFSESKKAYAFEKILIKKLLPICNKIHTSWTCSSVTRKKISIANKGRKHSLEARRKMSEASKERVVSLETRRKMSAAKKGKAPNNKGIPMKEMQKVKLSLLHSGKILSQEHKRRISLGLNKHYSISGQWEIDRKGEK